MNEAQLVNRQHRQDKGIAIWPPEAAVEVVQHIGEGEPCGEHVIKGAKAVAPRVGEGAVGAEVVGGWLQHPMAAQVVPTTERRA